MPHKKKRIGLASRKPTASVDLVASASASLPSTHTLASSSSSSAVPRSKGRGPPSPIPSSTKAHRATPPAHPSPPSTKTVSASSDAVSHVEEENATQKLHSPTAEGFPSPTAVVAQKRLVPIPAGGKAPSSSAKKRGDATSPSLSQQTALLQESPPLPPVEPASSSSSRDRECHSSSSVSSCKTSSLYAWKRWRKRARDIAFQYLSQEALVAHAQIAAAVDDQEDQWNEDVYETLQERKKDLLHESVVDGVALKRPKLTPEEEWFAALLLIRANRTCDRMKSVLIEA